MFLSPTELISRLNLKPGDKVADFGTGSGANLQALSNLVGPTGKVYALDINQPLLERLQKEAEKFFYTNIEFALSDVEQKIYLENQSCQAVILSNILFQVADPDAVIKQAKRILKSDGFLLIVDWKSSFNHLGPHPNHVLPEEKILAILAKNNLQIKKHLPAGEFHYALLVMI